jgi:hypothetical protein
VAQVPLALLDREIVEVQHQVQANLVKTDLAVEVPELLELMLLMLVDQ